jgi:hypothetical protein
VTDTQISVRYSRRLSDGGYGSEECSLEWTGRHEGSYGDIAAALRVQVLAFLSRSGAPEVAWKAKHELNPERKPVPDVDVREPITVTEFESLPF